MRPRYLIVPFTAALVLASCASSRNEAGAPTTSPAPAHHGKTAPTIGGAVLDPAGTIAANAARAPNLTTFVKLMQAAGLETTLTGAGPYTLFVPTNDAFGRLAPGTVDTLLKPENKASLVKLLDYVLIEGRVTTADLRTRITASGGTTTLATMEGDPLTVTLTDTVLTLTDVNGNKSYIQTGDVPQANGLIQVVNGVLIPNLE